MDGDLDSVLAGLLEVARDETPGPEPLNALTDRLLAMIDALSESQSERAILKLIDCLDGPHPQIGGHIAWLSGCIMENGANAEPLAKALAPRVAVALEDAGRFVQAVASLPANESDGDGGHYVQDRWVSPEQFDLLLQEDARAAQSFLALDKFCIALISSLTRAPDVLKSAAASLRRPLEGLEDIAQYTYYLDRLLRVPMEERWLILDPVHDRGFALQISGLANAFQVYALVHDALVHGPQGTDGWTAPVAVPGPPKEVVDVARGDGPRNGQGVYIPPFTLFRWSAVTRDRRVPNNDCTDHWYSNSAIPAELARFEDNRVAVIGEFGWKMEYAPSREFAGLRASVEVMEELRRNEVERLMIAFATAPSPGKPLPGVGWP